MLGNDDEQIPVSQDSKPTDRIDITEKKGMFSLVNPKSQRDS